jgi:hypothetical protein
MSERIQVSGAIEEKFGVIRGCGDPEQPTQTAKKNSQAATAVLMG